MSKKKVIRGNRNRCKKINKTDNKWTLFHLNIRGFNSKRKSRDNIVGQLKPNCITLNETGLRNRQKINYQIKNLLIAIDAMDK